MAAFTTYNASGAGHLARDVSDFVVNVSPQEAPFFSLIGSGTAVARTKENVTDTLTAAGANALVEGAAFTDTTLSTRLVESNVLQIFGQTINISGTQEAVIKFGGVNSEIEYQIIKQYTKLATDVEYALIQGTSATGTTAVARKMSGLIEKTTTNTATAALTGATWTGTADANYTAYEDLFNDLLQLGFTTGQTFDTVFVGGAQKRRISKLTTRVTRNVAASEKTQILSVNSYDSDFGVVDIYLDRYVPDANILAVKLDMWEVAYLRSFKQFPLGKTGDSTQISIVGELTLDGKTEKGAGKITAS
jgi:hypothetical protein